MIDLILRLRWWNLIGRTFYTWFMENGVETRRSYQVIGRFNNSRDSWVIRTDAGSLFYNYRGKSVRRSLIRKEVIEL